MLRTLVVTPCSHREMETLHVKLERKNISSLVVDHALSNSRVLIEKKVVALTLSVYQAVIIHYLKMIYNKKRK